MDSDMTEHIDVAFPTGNGLYRLELSMGAGTLQLNPGAAKGNSELGGLSLTALNIAQGASVYTVAFGRPNSVVLEKIV